MFALHRNWKSRKVESGRWIDLGSLQTPQSAYGAARLPLDTMMLRGESPLIGQSCGFHLALELCQAGEGCYHERASGYTVAQTRKKSVTKSSTR